MNRKQAIQNKAADWRKVKRYENKMMPDYPIYEAYCLGEWAAYCGTKHERINPYPPGRRHASWQRAYNLK